jgi:CO/xanthine dehydrogenase FAD-binding subunit
VPLEAGLHGEITDDGNTETGQDRHRVLKPAAFTYHRPETLDEAVTLLAEHGDDAKLLAGGQSLIPFMNFRLSRPAHIIDINRVHALELEREASDALELGALTRHRRLTQPDFRTKCQLLSIVSQFIGHPQIRVRGTLGGSASHADSAAELPGALLALDAEIVVTSVRGDRTIRASDFFTYHFTTSLADDEIVVKVRIPRHPGFEEGCGFGEIASRRGDFALTGSMVRLLRDESGAIVDTRIVLIGSGPTPLRITAAEQVLVGGGVTPASLRDVVAIIGESISPQPHATASREYLIRAAGELTKRSIIAAEETLRGYGNDN